MSKELLDALLDALFDTLKVFVVVFIVYIIFSFVEGKLAKLVEKKSKYSPLIGASIGLIPQCGFSIVSADLYLKKYITLGTLIAVFISCSDEAIPILISYPSKMIMIIPIILIKFFTAILFGYLIDLFIKKQIIRIHNHGENKFLNHSGCCHHEIEQEKETNLQKHLLHPLIHSLKITLYVFIINLLFSLIIYFIGEEAIKTFLNKTIYLTPLFTSIVGLIPNCASSVIITELFVTSSLSLGATISGLICNAGLGLIYLFKNKSNVKNAFLIALLLFIISLIVGYFILAIEFLI